VAMLGWAHSPAPTRRTMRAGFGLFHVPHITSPDKPSPMPTKIGIFFFAYCCGAGLIHLPRVVASIFRKRTA